MSTASPTPGLDQTVTLAEQTRVTAAKPQRVLACVLCQQRKIKCDRKFPCQSCVRAGVQCVPTSLAPRQRRRRFPERELIERLCQYEDLLRQNKVDFEPLHASAAAKASPNTDRRGDDSADDSHSGGRAVGPDGTSREKTAVNSEAVFEAKNLWHAIDPRSQDPDDSDDDGQNDDDHGSDSIPHTLREVEFKKAWDQYKSNDHLLFFSANPNIDIFSLHPQQFQIFKFWQIYLEKVDPLLKVTHTPTLQARIIDAIGDIASISPSLEALMFSIYCVSMHSLDEDESQALFRSPKKDLLMAYQSGCQQALLKCGFLRSSDRDCLTALYLYLISVRPDTDARSLSTMLGTAIRIAQRMKIHNESANAKCTALEAEMRRRLWWSLIIFDARISEKSGLKDVLLAPTWNCKTPLNVNDFDLRPEMKAPPAVNTEPTEAIFAILRSELSDFTRHSSSYLDFTNPVLKSVAKEHASLLEGRELITLEKTIEDKYLKLCNSENPLHFATIWTTRGYLAKSRLVEHYSRSSTAQTDEQGDVAIFHALRMLECDTMLLASPLTKCYLWWLMDLQFPFPAYLHIVQDLKRQPVGELVEKCWQVLSDNYKARFGSVDEKDNMFFKLFSRIILQAWAAREALCRQSGKPEEPPWIVSNVRDRVAKMTPNVQSSNMEQPDDIVGMNNDDFFMPMPMDFMGNGPLNSFGGQVPMDSGLGGLPIMPAQVTMGFDMNLLDWTATDWNPMYKHS